MKIKRHYHGWIIATPVGRGLNGRHFQVQYYNDNTCLVTRDIGYEQPAQAVNVFETELGLGPVKLEVTPLGLRVYTEEEVSNGSPTT